ncbi:MAG: hypothetical protein PHO20_00435 [Candidatus Peribacteraceae bacterium]|nr:hypothetical protein [Candidatus Peribacteraceae bacterium]
MEVRNESPEHDGKPDQPSAEELYKKALEALQQNFTTFANDVLCDTRLPAPDALGILADDQIRPHHFAEIQNIAAEYPGIDAIYVHASYRNCDVRQPYVEFCVHIDPFSRELQRAHWPIGERIEQLFGGKKFPFYFLPTMEMEEYCATVLLYRKPKQLSNDLATHNITA